MEAVEWAEEHKENKKTIVSTNGCFDLLHTGHISYLEDAKKLGDFLIVGVNSDESVRKLKGSSRPIHNELERARMLAALESVDCVCVFSEETPLRWLHEIQSALHCKGGDYKAEELPEYPVLKQWGGEIKIIPFLKGYSSSNIIKKIKNI